MIDLRDYQKASIQMLRKSIAEKHLAPVLVASTGFGKTRVAASICESAVSRGKRVLFITPRRGLTLQAEQSFDELGVNASIIMAGVEHDWHNMVEVASMDTIISRISKGVRTTALTGVNVADIIIVDECHLSVSEKRRDFLNSCLSGEYEKKKLIIGLTASPCVSGGGGLGAVYDDLVVPAGMIELIRDGYLVQPRYYAAPKPDLSEVKMTGGEYQSSGLGDAFADKAIMGDVVKNWLRIAKDTSTVIFTPTRANAAHLVSSFIDIGVNAEYLDAHTSDSDRADIYKRVADGHTKVIANVGIVSLGTDIPRLQTVVMATATKSISKWIQAVGRALRPYKGKDYAIIIDHGGMSLDVGMGPVEYINDWSLDIKETIQERVEARKKDGKEPKEIACEQCKTVFKGRHNCPECGHAMKQKTEAIECHEAELKEVSPPKANRQMSWDDKIRFMGELRQHCVNTGKRPGWAAHKYREKTGVWPNDKRVKNAPPVPVSQDTKAWITSQNIRYAKRNAA